MLILLKNSKILDTRFPCALCRIATFRLRIRPALKEIYDLFDEVENAASLYCKNNYDLKILGESNDSFCKTPIVDVWQVPEYISDFEYLSALNISGL